MALPPVLLSLLPAALAAATCTPFTTFTSGAHGLVTPAGRGFLLTTDAGDASTSFGSALPNLEPFPTQLLLQVTVQRLSPEGELPIGLSFPGASLLLRDGAWALWESEAQLARDGWHAAPGLDTHQRHALLLRQSGRRVEIDLDGAPLARLRLDAEPAPGQIAVFFQGARAAEGSLWFADFCASGQ